jgi:hypothetical protein
MLVGGEEDLRVEGPVRLGHGMDEIRTGCDVIVYLPRRSKKTAASSNRETASEETNDVCHRVCMEGLQWY